MFSLLLSFYKSFVKSILDKHEGKKTLVIDPSLSRLLSTVTGLRYLKQNGAEEVELLEIEEVDVKTPSAHIVYLIRPNSQMIRLAAQQIRRYRGSAGGGARGSVKDKSGREYHIYFVPRRTVTAVKLLEIEGLRGVVSVWEYPLEFAPLEDDVLSLEDIHLYRDWYLFSDRSPLQDTALALANLIRFYRSSSSSSSSSPLLPRISGKGSASLIVKNLLQHLLEQDHKKSAEVEKIIKESHEEEQLLIDHIVLIDREIDHFTPFLTQLTYQGMLDEVCGIQCGYVELENWMYGGDKDAPPRKFRLSGEDALFQTIRDMSFADVLNQMTDIVQSVSAELKSASPTELKSMEISQLRNVTKRLPDLVKKKQSIETHINLTKKVTQGTENQHFTPILGCESDILEGDNFKKVRVTLENFINRQTPMIKVLRLMCLYSLCHGGFKREDFDFFRTIFLQSYGYQHLPTLVNLEKAGLLTCSSGSFPYRFKVNWKSARSGMKLIVTEQGATRRRGESGAGGSKDIKDSEPSLHHIYSYSGYVPLSVRCVQSHLVNDNWKHVDKTLAGASILSSSVTSLSATSSSVPISSAILSCPSFDSLSTTTPRAKEVDQTKSETGSSKQDSGSSLKDSTTRPRVTVVCFVGGVTYPELAAMRYLHQHNKMGASLGKRRLVFATTGLVNGTKLLQEFIDSSVLIPTISFDDVVEQREVDIAKTGDKPTKR